MQIMIFTTFVESCYFGIQAFLIYSQPPSDVNFCYLVHHYPRIGFLKNCWQKVQFYGLFYFIILLAFWYFCCIAYEYYHMGSQDVYLLEYERRKVEEQRQKVIKLVQRKLDEEASALDETIEFCDAQSARSV